MQLEILDDKPLISVVLPTGGRSEKLRYTLETILSQEQASFEVVLHDNCTSDGTADVVARISDPRLKYFRTEERLSMTDNFEAAVGRANGKYVMLMGDDDAILPGGLAFLQQSITHFGAKAFWWKCASYNWPKSGEDGWVEVLPRSGKSRVLQTRRVVQIAAQSGSMFYLKLPLVYHSLVSAEVLGAVRAKLGRVFDTLCPDLFMAFALPPFVPEFVDVGRSITVRGQSEWVSSGVVAYRSEGNVFQVKMKRLVDESKAYEASRRLHPCMPEVVNFQTETILVAMAKFPEYYQKINFNFEYLYAYVARTCNFDGIWDIIDHRLEIRRYHHFSLPRFCVYILLQYGFALRAKIMRLVRARKAKETFSVCPANIAEFSRSFPIGNTRAPITYQDTERSA